MTVESAGTVDPAILAFVTSAEPALLRHHIGLSWLELEPTRLVQQFSPPISALDDDGRMPFGLLAVLADSTIGSAGAVAGDYRSGVTVGLRVEMARPISDGLTTVVAASSVVHADPDGSMATANLTSPNGEALGVASARMLALGRGSAAVRASGAEEPLGTPPSPTRAEDGIDGLLGVHGVEVIDGRCRLEVRTRDELRNGLGRIHGGIVAAMAQRGAHHAIASTAQRDERVHHLVLDVDFTRPVPVGEGRLEVQAGVITRTRRYAWAESEVVLPDGRTAAHARIMAAIETGRTET